MSSSCRCVLKRRHPIVDIIFICLFIACGEPFEDGIERTGLPHLVGKG